MLNFKKISATDTKKNAHIHIHSQIYTYTETYIQR